MPSANQAEERLLSLYVGIFLFLIIICVVFVYYGNAPFVERGPDTPGYLAAAYHLQITGIPVDYFRLPTYSFFLLGIYALAGQNHLMAVSAAQGILFVCATMEIYFLTLLVTQRKWLAFCVGLLVGTNIILLYNVKLIMTEGLSLWLLTTIIFSIILFLKNRRPLFLWISSACLLLLIFARPEWVPFPCLLFLYVILSTRKKLPMWKVILPVASSLAVMYLLIAAYIYANARINHLASLSVVSNMNLIGKVLQYRMQNQTPYDPYLSHIYDSYVRQGQISPYYITYHVHGLNDNYAQASAHWAENIILHHPVEFLVKSIPPFFTSLYYYPPFSTPIAHGKFFSGINALLQVHVFLSITNILFLPCALIWIILCCHRKTRHIFSIQAMGLLALTVTYALIITTLGGYTDGDYLRVHVVFDPLITLVVWGSAGLGLSELLSRMRGKKNIASSIHYQQEAEQDNISPEIGVS